MFLQKISNVQKLLAAGIKKISTPGAEAKSFIEKFASEMNAENGKTEIFTGLLFVIC